MRLWTIHPRYLDALGLVALWREALLARAVLRGRTRGYRHHPQLNRFRRAPNPVTCLNAYLRIIYDESVRRGYRFDPSKLGRGDTRRGIPATSGQLTHEWEHLKNKLKLRSPEKYREVAKVRHPQAHPLFTIRPGPVQDWERPAARGTN